jgi:hypothetical protein
MSKIARFPWYVIFISVYPALFYWAFNATEMSSINGFKLVLFSFLFGLLCWGLFLLLFRNFGKASLATFFALLLFWSYGHLHNYLVTIHPLVFRHAVHLTIWVILFLLAVVWLYRKNPDALKLAGILNLTTAFLLVYPTIQVLPRAIQESRSSNPIDNRTILAPVKDIQPVNLDSPPDVYYIILDTYGRQDVLQDYFSYDNSEFLAQLKELGFYVANCSQTNYAQTRLSLSSSLNYRYLDDLYPIDPESKDVPLLIKRSAVQRIFEDWGYKIVAFESGHFLTELKDADIYYSRSLSLFTITEFDWSYLETSFLQAFMRESLLRADLLMDNPYRSRSLYVLDKLELVAKEKGPKFVFAHIMLPHPPFVFGPNGETVILPYPTEDKKADLKTYKIGIVNQTRFLNSRMIQILQRITIDSETPPIIIIQGDHGPFVGKHQVTSILNAFYLPEGSQGLYDTITPVNTFRYIFNRYFGQNFEMEQDVAHWSGYQQPYQFEVIPNDCKTDLQTGSP